MVKTAKRLSGVSTRGKCQYNCLPGMTGCLLYADDIVLVAHTVSSMRVGLMLQVCDNFAVAL